jgi:hypothetical protein
MASCAEGGGTTIPLNGDGGATGTGNCGDGFVDTAANEVCECPLGATTACLVMDKTCADLNPGNVGQLLCDPALCMYVVSMCMAPTGVAGSGGGGAGG